MPLLMIILTNIIIGIFSFVLLSNKVNIRTLLKSSNDINKDLANIGWPTARKEKIGIDIAMKYVLKEFLDIE